MNRVRCKVVVNVVFGLDFRVVPSASTSSTQPYINLIALRVMEPMDLSTLLTEIESSEYYADNLLVTNEM